VMGCGEPEQREEERRACALHGVLQRAGEILDMAAGPALPWLTQES
jgi:hypothetical protein